MFGPSPTPCRASGVENSRPRHARRFREPSRAIEKVTRTSEVIQRLDVVEHRGRRETTPLRAGASSPRPPAKRSSDDQRLYWEREGNRAVRAGDWKIVAKGRGGPWELSDLATDCAESRTSPPEQPERVARLRGGGSPGRCRTRVLPWVWNPADSAAPSRTRRPTPGPSPTLKAGQGPRGNHRPTTCCGESVVLKHPSQ